MKRVLIGILILMVTTIGLTACTRQEATNQPPISSEPVNEGDVEQVAENLEIPWEMVFLPNSDIMVTERPGRLKMIDDNGESQLVAEIEDVLHVGEGGLMGLALHPDFATNNIVFVYYTYAATGNNTMNRVVRYTLTSQGLIQPEVIVDSIPGAANHNGGRIKFGPDGYLYIGTGDAGEPSLAQDTGSLAGKILRVTENGEPVPENPLGNEVYSYGHRNVQGLVWDSQQRLWATEHGPSANDEVNLIEAGANYGWPVIQGNRTREGMRTPIINSGSSTWAPSGMTIIDGTIYFAGLRGNALYSYTPDDGKVTPLFESEYGRIRNVVAGPLGNLFILTNNRDGRGRPAGNDDRILKIPFVSESTSLSATPF